MKQQSTFYSIFKHYIKIKIIMKNELSGESSSMTLGIIIAEDNIIWSLKVEVPGSSRLPFPGIAAKEESSDSVNAQAVV